MPPDIPPAFADLIRRCTLNDPAARPSFELVAAELASADGPAAAGDAAMERHRTKHVLAQVFPPRVAAALKEGRPVEPERHGEATVFFSDIAG